MPIYCYKSKNEKSMYYNEPLEVYIKSPMNLTPPKDEFGDIMKKVICRGKTLLNLRGDGWYRRGLQ